MAGALAAGGGVGLLVRQQKAAQFNAYRGPQNARCNIPAPQNGGGPCSGYLRSSEQARTIAIVGFVGAGLLAVISGILIATSPTPRVEPLAWRF
jgi:hypothetical protein